MTPKELSELETKTRSRVEKARALLAAKPEDKQLQVGQSARPH